MKDVYITDHSPNPKRLHTNSVEEDADFFNYDQKVKEFHASSATSLKERSDNDFTHPGEKIIKKEFEAMVKAQEEGEDSEDDEDEAEKEYISQ